jgi:hypothetical protein
MALVAFISYILIAIIIIIIIIAKPLRKIFAPERDDVTRGGREELPNFFLSLYRSVNRMSI